MCHFAKISEWESAVPTTDSLASSRWESPTTHSLESDVLTTHSLTSHFIGETSGIIIKSHCLSPRASGFLSAPQVIKNSEPLELRWHNLLIDTLWISSCCCCCGLLPSFPLLNLKSRTNSPALLPLTAVASSRSLAPTISIQSVAPYSSLSSLRVRRTDILPMT